MTLLPWPWLEAEVWPVPWLEAEVLASGGATQLEAEAWPLPWLDAEAQLEAEAWSLPLLDAWPEAAQLEAEVWPLPLVEPEAPLSWLEAVTVSIRERSKIHQHTGQPIRPLLLQKWQERTLVALYEGTTRVAAKRLCPRNVCS